MINSIDFIDAKTKVLLIEDHPGDVLLFKHACTKCFENLSITDTGSVRNAIKLLQNEGFDVIFTDLNMSDSIGASSIKDLRKICSDTPIVVLTGIATQITREECAKAGAVAVILKSELSGDSVAKVLEAIGFKVDKS